MQAPSQFNLPTLLLTDPAHYATPTNVFRGGTFTAFVSGYVFAGSTLVVHLWGNIDTATFTGWRFYFDTADGQVKAQIGNGSSIETLTLGTADLSGAYFFAFLSADGTNVTFSINGVGATFTLSNPSTQCMGGVCSLGYDVNNARDPSGSTLVLTSCGYGDTPLNLGVFSYAFSQLYQGNGLLSPLVTAETLKSTGYRTLFENDGDHPPTAYVSAARPTWTPYATKAGTWDLTLTAANLVDANIVSFAGAYNSPGVGSGNTPGSVSLQDAYDGGNTIAIAGDTPVEISKGGDTLLSVGAVDFPQAGLSATYLGSPSATDATQFVSVLLHGAPGFSDPAGAPGAGGFVAISTGKGGDGGSGTPTGGVGGDVMFRCGNGGAADVGGSPGTGGYFQVITGDGGVATTAGSGGVGGSAQISTGHGSASGATAVGGVGGRGGHVELLTGDGGLGSNADSLGGAGGNLYFTSGDGGDSQGVGNDGGYGGDVIYNLGDGGEGVLGGRGGNIAHITGDGGIGTATGGAGGSLQLGTGNGGGGATGGVGGAATVYAGTGGVGTTLCGDGGNFTLSAGSGGTGPASEGGGGGVFILTAGAGGNTNGVAADGRPGGTMTIAAGIGGDSDTQAGGEGGECFISSGGGGVGATAGGAGALLTLKAGNGGNGGAAGGDGGTVDIDPGLAGSGGGGTNGEINLGQGVAPSAVNLAAANLILTNVATTGNAANAVIDAGTGQVQRSTSLSRYKDNQRALDFNTSAVYRLVPKSYESNLDRHKDGTPITQFGLVAEEVAAVLPQLAEYTPEGELTGVQYSKLAVVLLAELKKLHARIEELETKSST